MKDPGDLAKGPGPRSLRQHATGSVRDTRRGKGRFDLLPPTALRRLARHYEEGAEKYGDRNYEKGMPLSWFLDSAGRHWCQLLNGENDEDHAAAVAWNMMAFMHSQHLIELGLIPPDIDDLPNYDARRKT